ncbi:MAG: Rdx family protein [Acidimicrobiia bacterium]|nr:Rdx family protein [Acidimicrobiia bacterium]
MIEGIELVPSTGGRFEVVLDDETVFSKAALGRHAEPGEVAALVRRRIGPEVPGTDPRSPRPARPGRGRRRCGRARSSPTAPGATRSRP